MSEGEKWLEEKSNYRTHTNKKVVDVDDKQLERMKVIREGTSYVREPGLTGPVTRVINEGMRAGEPSDWTKWAEDKKRMKNLNYLY